MAGQLVGEYKIGVFWSSCIYIYIYKMGHARGHRCRKKGEPTVICSSGLASFCFSDLLVSDELIFLFRRFIVRIITSCWMDLVSFYFLSGWNGVGLWRLRANLRFMFMGMWNCCFWVWHSSTVGRIVFS